MVFLCPCSCGRTKKNFQLCKGGSRRSVAGARTDILLANDSRWPEQCDMIHGDGSTRNRVQHVVVNIATVHHPLTRSTSHLTKSTHHSTATLNIIMK